MANKRLADGYTQFGANFVYAQGAGSLYDMIDHFQAGKVYLTGIGGNGASEVKATGTFENTMRATPNYIGFSPVVNPSGGWWVSSYSTTGFVVTFAASPNGGGTPSVFTSSGLYVGDWFVCM